MKGALVLIDILKPTTFLVIVVAVVMSASDLAAVINLLMGSPVQKADTTPPTAPSLLTGAPSQHGFRLAWSRGVEPDLGNWVAYYNVYRDDTFIGKAHGLQFFDPSVTMGATITLLRL